MFQRTLSTRVIRLFLGNETLYEKLPPGQSSYDINEERAPLEFQLLKARVQEH